MFSASYANEGAMLRRDSIKIILGCVVAYFLLVVLCSGESLDRGLAEDPNLKGKGKDGACMDYALALSSRLAANGIHGQLIFYRWRIRNTAIQGSHVFVAYHLSDGSEWIVDNEIPHPKKVPREASPMQLVFLLSDSQSDPVDVQLQDGLNHLSYF
jgi:hypothetical protein